MLRRTAIVALALAALNGGVAAHAQTPAERCLTMRLSLLGSTLSQRMQCHAWAAGTRTQPAPSCLARGDLALAERLRSAGCASEEEIGKLIDLVSCS
jgi:hypothetical protein